jgi:hypothetical protein
VVFIKEFIKVLSAYPVMPAGKPEGRQLAGLYPPQNGSVTHAAMLGDKANRDIFRI